MDLPSHPDTGGEPSEQPPRPTTSRATLVLVAVLAALVAAMVILHLTGIVGPPD